MLELYNDRLIDLLRSPDLEPVGISLKFIKKNLVYSYERSASSCTKSKSGGGIELETNLKRNPEQYDLVDRASHPLVKINLWMSVNLSEGFYWEPLGFNASRQRFLINATGDAQAKLEIKKDSDGVVWVQGARVCAVEDAAQLGGLFQLGLARRHSSATLMNDRSSRSHLIVSVSVESVSRLHGTVIRGKVQLRTNGRRDQFLLIVWRWFWTPLYGMSWIRCRCWTWRAASATPNRAPRPSSCARRRRSTNRWRRSATSSQRWPPTSRSFRTATRSWPCWCRTASEATPKRFSSSQRRPRPTTSTRASLL